MRSMSRESITAAATPISWTAAGTTRPTAAGSSSAKSRASCSVIGCGTTIPIAMAGIDVRPTIVATKRRPTATALPNTEHPRCPHLRRAIESPRRCRPRTIGHLHRHLLPHATERPRSLPLRITERLPRLRKQHRRREPHLRPRRRREPHLRPRRPLGCPRFARRLASADDRVREREVLEKRHGPTARSGQIARGSRSWVTLPPCRKPRSRRLVRRLRPHEGRGAADSLDHPEGGTRESAMHRVASSE
jgi:hypothetical protein